MLEFGSTVLIRTDCRAPCVAKVKLAVKRDAFGTDVDMIALGRAGDCPADAVGGFAPRPADGTAG